MKIILLLLALSLVSCGGGSDSKPSEESKQPSKIYKTVIKGTVSFVNFIVPSSNAANMTCEYSEEMRIYDHLDCFQDSICKGEEGETCIFLIKGKELIANTIVNNQSYQFLLDYDISGDYVLKVEKYDDKSYIRNLIFKVGEEGDKNLSPKSTVLFKKKKELLESGISLGSVLDKMEELSSLYDDYMTAHPEVSISSSLLSLSLFDIDIFSMEEQYRTEFLKLAKNLSLSYLDSLSNQEILNINTEISEFASELGDELDNLDFSEMDISMQQMMVQMDIDQLQADLERTRQQKQDKESLLNNLTLAQSEIIQFESDYKEFFTNYMTIYNQDGDMTSLETPYNNLRNFLVINEYSTLQKSFPEDFIMFDKSKDSEIQIKIAELQSQIQNDIQNTTQNIQSLEGFVVDYLMGIDRGQNQLVTLEESLQQLIQDNEPIRNDISKINHLINYIRNYIKEYLDNVRGIGPA